MTKQTQSLETLQLQDVKDLANTPGPCVTLFLPRQHAENTLKVEATHLKGAIREAEQRLADRGMQREEIESFMRPIHDIAHDLEPSNNTQTRSLVVLRSADVFRSFEVPIHLDDAVYVADHFQLVQILPAIVSANQDFYILALSQKHVRLLRCSMTSSEEVPMPEDIPLSMNAWLTTRMPNESPDHSGPSGGGSFNSTSDMDKKDMHLWNFYKVIDRALHNVLRDDNRPVILAGVEYEVSMYKSLSGLQHIAADAVHGSPDGLKGGELHKRALEIFAEEAKAPTKKALDQFEQNGGSDRASHDPEALVRAAHQARVAHLFIAEGARYTGEYDPTTLRVKQREGGQDLLNLAALQTIALGGDVFVIPQDQVPGQGPMAAVLRF